MISGMSAEVSDVNSRDSILFQDSLKTHLYFYFCVTNKFDLIYDFGCLGLGLVGWCLGLDVVVLSIS